MGKLAFELMAQGKDDEAEPLFRETLDVARETYGSQHPATLSFINSLGLLQPKKEAKAARQDAEIKAREARHDAEVLSKAPEDQSGSWEQSVAKMKEVACSWEREAELSLGPAQKDLCRSKAATYRRKAAIWGLKFAEAEAKQAVVMVEAEAKAAAWLRRAEAEAVVRAEKEAKVNAAADALLAEEAAEKAAAAAMKARDKAKRKAKGKGKGKSTGNAAAQPAATAEQEAAAAARRAMHIAAHDAHEEAEQLAKRLLALKHEQRSKDERIARSRRAAPAYTKAGPSHKASGGKSGKGGGKERDVGSQLQHEVHVLPDQKVLRSEASDAMQQIEHLEAKLEKARNTARGLALIRHSL